LREIEETKIDLDAADTRKRFLQIHLDKTEKSLDELFNCRTILYYRDEQGRDPLTIACYSSETLALKLLQLYGRDFIPADEIPYNTKIVTALQLACDKKLTRVASQLIDLFKDCPCMRDPVKTKSYPSSVLLLACQRGLEEVVVKLLETFGASSQVGKISDIDQFDLTVWEYAKQHKWQTVMSLIKKLT